MKQSPSWRSPGAADAEGDNRELTTRVWHPEAVAEARRVLRAALAELPDEDALRPSLLNELGRALGMQHALDSSDTDMLDEAIRRARQAVTEAESPDIRGQARLLQASALGRLYENSGQRPDLGAEIQDQLRSVVTAPGPTDDRISAARQWAELCVRVSDWDGILKAVEAAVELVPILVSRRLARDDQRAAAARLQGLASLGAAAALSLDRPATTGSAPGSHARYRRG